MGCSSSTLSIPGRMSPPVATINQPICDRRPPVQRIASRSCLSFDDFGYDTWELIDEEECDGVIVSQNVSLHKMLETYEFVETEHFFSSSAVDRELNNVSRKNEANVVLYVTSMRGIRKTYDDCRAISSILDGFRVVVDKKDIAMNVMYRTELQRLLGKPISLPQLFIGDEHVGGADEVREMYESGELRELLKECRVRGSVSVACICGVARFLLCGQCCGSKKVFHEQHKMSSNCCQCNENGLVKCPTCNA